MKLNIFTALILISFSIKAQSFEKIFSLTSGSNTNEYANTGIILNNGNYLFGINNKVLCLSPSGDSLWSKIYTGYGDVAKIFFNSSNELLIATTKGKMTILKIDPTNGDSIGNIFIPGQIPNGGYIIYDMVVLPNNDIVYCYNNGGGFGGIITRFTPGQNVNSWSNDYAGQNWAPKNILVDDSTLVIAGYKGTSSYAKLVVRKIGISNTQIWNKEMERGTYYADRKLGIGKNINGEYLVATSFNMFNVLAPTVIKLSNQGDSLSASWVSNYQGNAINHGYMTSLTPTTNGYYAAGYLGFDKINPDNVLDGMGHMAVFFVNDNGLITQAKAYNKVGFYQFGPGSGYDGSEAWGNGCLTTSSGKYVLYGIGNKIFDPGTGANYQAQWRGYIVQSDSLHSVSGYNEYSSDEFSFRVFPNPANDKLYVSTNDENRNVSYQILDLNGRLMQEGNCFYGNNTIFLSLLDNGIYLIKLIHNNHSQILKLIKM